MQNEQRLSFVDHLGVFMADVVREGIREHEAGMHAQSGVTQSEEPALATASWRSDLQRSRAGGMGRLTPCCIMPSMHVWE